MSADYYDDTPRQITVRFNGVTFNERALKQIPLDDLKEMRDVKNRRASGFKNASRVALLVVMGAIGYVLAPDWTEKQDKKKDLLGLFAATAAIGLAGGVYHAVGKAERHDMIALDRAVAVMAQNMDEALLPETKKYLADEGFLPKSQPK